MVTSFFHARRRAFTLIELLTVIAIVGILAAILIPAVTQARAAANKAKSKSQLTQWATAMTSFKQEYGYYPSISAGNNKLKIDYFVPALTGKANTKGDSLSSVTAATTYGNIKLIAFYTLSGSDLDSSSTADSPPIVDAFGNTDIAVRVDTNGDGKIDTNDVRAGVYTAEWPTVTSVNTGEERIVTNADPTIATAGGVHAGVVFYSAGKGSSDSDIVRTWQ
ncbi:MAG: prepilin-type N-terminal cleavage/methylation domain-containing protein [Verrucomicrobia bacterium]|nr:prepilin-type N-terminal cleavage/methylation domain-containing protein [Verrucomicrobiota bacterium]